MARRIGGEVVMKDGKLLIGTLVSVLLGVPIYALSVEVAEFITLVGGGYAAAYRNLAAWLATFVDVGLSSPAAGFEMAVRSFTAAVGELGVAAFVVAVVVAAVTVWVFLVGVSRVF